MRPRHPENIEFSQRRDTPFSRLLLSPGVPRRGKSFTRPTDSIFSDLAGQLHVTTSSFDPPRQARYPVGCGAKQVRESEGPDWGRMSVTKSETNGSRGICSKSEAKPGMACFLVAESRVGAPAAQLGTLPRAGGLRRIFAATVLPFVIVAGFLFHTGVAFAQIKPDGVSAYVDSLGVHITVSACSSDAYGSDQAETNCYNFGIYRNPPGFDKSSIGTAYLVNSAVIPFTDPDSPTLKVGQTYSYRVCTNVFPDSSGSNCKDSNSITIPAKTPHWFKEVPTKTVAYYAVNIESQ